MTDLAKRVYDHTWKIDPIVRSLLDTDFYKLLMAQTILRDGAPILTASVTAALINDRGRPQRMPREWAALFGGTLS